jgi:hypothetical protein
VESVKLIDERRPAGASRLPHAKGTGAWRRVRIPRHGTILDTDRPSRSSIVNLSVFFTGDFSPESEITIKFEEK